MGTQLVGFGIAGSIMLATPMSASAADLPAEGVAAALGGSWDREIAGRSRLMKAKGLIPAECAPGRFTAAAKGRAVYYFGSELQGFPRSANTEVLTYPSARAARRGLEGLQDWVKLCPGPVQECTACDAGSFYQSKLKGARLGRLSYGWWSASPGGLEAAYTTSIAFVRGRMLGVASYRVYDTQDPSLDRSFVPSIQKTEALAARLRQRL
jgi:hypothetical protein